MKRLILHWTAGSYAPSFIDKQFYHYLIDGEGFLHSGIYPPEANLNVKSGRYASHCGGGNTGSIGVALCAMAGFQSPDSVGNFPIKKHQLEAFLAFCAGLCGKYHLPVTEQTVLTHYEFGRKYPNSSSGGKVDICFLPCYPDIKPRNVGGFLRQKIQQYQDS